MKKILLIIAILCFSSNVSAGSLFYIGGNAGLAEKGSSRNPAYGIHAGVGIIPFIGIEAGRWDFGSFDDTDYTSLYLAAKPNITFADFHLYAKLGLDYYDKSGDISDDGIDVMYGVGAEYFLGRNISLGASYMSFGFDSDSVGTLTFGATFHFP